MLKTIGNIVVKPARTTLQLADRSLKFPYGVAKDVLVKVDKFVFSVYFVIIDIEEDSKVPLILVRLFFVTSDAVIDVPKGELTLKVNKEEETFQVCAKQHTTPIHTLHTDVENHEAMKSGKACLVDNTNIKVHKDITKKKRVATPFDDQPKPPWLSEV
jgi:hypothetical protein